jgi:hypothetical protein
MESSAIEGIDENTLGSIADVIIDDDGPHYRQGWELPGFFRRAGWSNVPDYDDSGRRRWVLEQLHERRRHSGDIEKVILRLADPREYQQSPKEAFLVAQRLNRILSLEALKVIHESGRPIVIRLAAPVVAPDSPAPVNLKKDIAVVVRDRSIVEVLRVRLDEASTCRDHGASLAAVILLGSILEGVLLDVTSRSLAVAMRAKRAPKDRQGRPQQDLSRWRLEHFIDVAHELHWIQADVPSFAHSLRRYRNLVHPNAQLEIGDFPDSDTVDVCWSVVVAALNDLGDTVGGSSSFRVDPET